MAEKMVSEMEVLKEEEEQGILGEIKVLKQNVEAMKNIMQGCLWDIEQRLDNICQIYEEEMKLYKAESIEEATEDAVNERTPRDETLSDQTEDIIKKNISGPLSPEVFREFLLHRAWGKPKPPVLPIVRQYGFDVIPLTEQLKALKNELNQRHKNYKEVRKLDVNLIIRIDKLLNNIAKELSAEQKDGKRQIPITDYYKDIHGSQ